VVAKFEPRNGRFGSSGHCYHCKIFPSRVYVDPRTDLGLRLFWQLLVLSKAGQNESQCPSHEVSESPYIITSYEFLAQPLIYLSCITS
jgi:hypothetical protein